MPDDVAVFTVPPVVKTITVRRSPADAFRLFVDGIGEWWPLKTHSLGSEPPSCAIEGTVGGRVYERGADGAETPWGRVTGWDPPQRLAFTWTVNLPDGVAQSVEVTFTPVPEGTRVQLTHSGWEQLGEAGAKRRELYDRGWVTVFEQRYGGYAETAA